MTAYIIAGIVIVIAVFFTLCRIAPLRRWLGYATLVDIAFTVLMLAMFHETFSGLMAAAFAGLFMAMMLTALRKAVGFERVRFRRSGWWFASEWVSYEPSIKYRKPKVLRVLAKMWEARNA